MSKFQQNAPKIPQAVATGPFKTTDRTVTHEGGAGYSRSAESELFLLAATNFVGQDTYYEDAATRDARFAHLVDEVTRTNPAWVEGFIDYLRNSLQMRSASVVLAAEYVKAGGPNGRAVVSKALQRGDEPAEMLGYWMSRYGRKLPAPVKRGVADAATRLFTERSALRYDGLSRKIRMADVIELVHPKPQAEWQSALFHYLLDKRHHPDETNAPPLLKTIVEDEKLLAAPEETRRALLKAGATQAAGWSWERLSGWLPGGMDAEAWESLIPTMGYMALIRNLRNFDEQNISKAARAAVVARIQDPEEVAKSRQFPYRFWSAYRNAPSLHWASALEEACELSVQNIPELPGRTLVLIDISGSMQASVGAGMAAYRRQAAPATKVMRFEVGALFGAALAKRTEKVDVGLFADSTINLPVKSSSLLRYVEAVHQKIGVVGYGTQLHGAIRDMYDSHDRVVIFSDEAAHDCERQTQGLDIPVIHVFNLAGYRAATVPSGPGRFVYGGFSDSSLVLMQLLEQGINADWPWMN